MNAGAKVIITLSFIITVVSFDRYDISGLTPFFLFPLLICGIGNIPPKYVIKKLIAVAPFAVVIGIFNPLVDRKILFHIGSWGISGGWVSFCSIIMRFILTVSAAVLLVAVTGFNAICASLEKFGMPRIFIVQLMFMYRYLFVLSEESERMSRARAARSFNSKHPSLAVYIPLIGQLLLRTLDRAERIYQAMKCRGFNGHFQTTRTSSGRKGLFFAAVCIGMFIFFRFSNIPLLIGTAITGVFR